jgi:hypothetical protein
MSAPWISGHRPIRLPGWTKLSLNELIGKVEDSLDEFNDTPAYDMGYRASTDESYLQGLRDAKKLIIKWGAP